MGTAVPRICLLESPGGKAGVRGERGHAPGAAKHPGDELSFFGVLHLLPAAADTTQMGEDLQKGGQSTQNQNGNPYA